LGSIERADEIADSIRNPMMQRLARRALKHCGNCGHRYTCSMKIVDMNRALTFLSGPEELSIKGKPSIIARTGAQVFDERCRQCVNLTGCVNKWLTADAEQAKELSEVFKSIPRERMEVIFEAILQDQGLSKTRFIGRVTKLWWECKEEGMETNAVMRMKG
jgi:hypothetical protein